MWINNGNEISKMYAGTGAIQGSSKVNVNFHFGHYYSCIFSYLFDSGTITFYALKNYLFRILLLH